jgi:hypothetical protein
LLRGFRGDDSEDRTITGFAGAWDGLEGEFCSSLGGDFLDWDGLEGESSFSLGGDFLNF